MQLLLKQVICWSSSDATRSSKEGKFDHLNFTSVSDADMDAVLSVEDKLEFLKKRFYSVASCGTSFRSSFSDAIDCFIQTGNTAPVTRNEIVCVNPTLLKHGYLEMNIASNPFDAFFPIAFNEDTQDTQDINTYNYCKAKLGLLVSEFIKHKERIKSYFHFGNCLELCLYKEDVKKICHIIFCSISIEHNLGLPNLFTAAKECLSETSDSVRQLAKPKS